MIPAGRLLAATFAFALSAVPVVVRPDDAVTRTLSAGTERGPTWAQIRPLLEELAERESSYAPEPGRGHLRTPVFAGEHGAAGLHLNLGGFDRPRVDMFAAMAEQRWIEHHLASGRSKPQLAADYERLLRAGEAELRARDLTIASVGSGFEYLLETAFEVLDGPRQLSPSEHRDLQGFVVMLVSAAESNPNSTQFVGAGNLEGRYEEAVVEAQTLRENGNKDEATDDLKGIGIDPKLSLGTMICSLPSPKPCSAVTAEANPIFERLAVKYPY